MNKLMIAAATVAFAVAAQAGIVVNTNCKPRSASCPVAAFKVTANGKIAAPSKSGEYKTATKLQVKKGALIIFPTEQVKGAGYSQEDCCYDVYSLYLKVKVGKTEYPVGVFYEQLDSWSIFGKKYNKSLDATKSKKYSVESEIGFGYAVTGSNSGISAQNGLGDSVTDTPGLGWVGPLSDFALIATAFGKGTYAYSYKVNNKACSVCSVDEGYEFTPKSYSGWFAGLVSDFGGEVGCLMCNCASIDVFGGTWKASYNKSWSKTADDWEKAASYVFGAGALAAMKEADVE